MTTMYYSRGARSFQRAPGADTIAVPGHVHARILEDQRSGKNIDTNEEGTPLDVAALLTTNGMRAAVLREMREQRALILNALTGVGYDAMRAGDTVLMAHVDTARAFLKNITTDPDVLAVTPDNGGWEAMSLVILNKWKAFAATVPTTVRNTFLEVAT